MQSSYVLAKASKVAVYKNLFVQLKIIWFECVIDKASSKLKDNCKNVLQ